MKLLVVRHAIAMEKLDYQLAARPHGQVSAPLAKDAPKDAVKDQPDINDDFRPLTLEGIKKMRKNARGLATFVKQPALLVSSPLTRAVQTSEILQDRWAGLEILVAQDLRPGSRPQALATWINQKVEGDEHVCIVGHEPHLSGLVSWCLKGSIAPIVEIKKGGACLIHFEHGPIAKSGGVLEWLALPAFLRALK